MAYIKFIVERSVYTGSGYTDWRPSSGYSDYGINIPRLRKMIEEASYTKHKLMALVIQSDGTEKVLFEKPLTVEYLAQLSISKDALLLLVDIPVITEEI